MMRLFLCLMILSAGTFPVLAQDGEEPHVTGDDSFQETDEEGNRTFRGYRCTQDCSGHKAGYNWAEKKGIDTLEACGGSSNSFREGCRAYVAEHQD